MKTFTASDTQPIAEGILDVLGEDISSERFRGLPRRLASSWGTLFAGYRQSPEELLGRAFPADDYRGMVILKDIEYFSTCEHHLLPFYGKAHVAYLPGDRVVGISKLARLVDLFARRLQIQERMTDQIADAIETHLGASGVGVVVEGIHLCMRSRGVGKQNSTMVTSALRGSLTGAEGRAEFMSLLR